MIETPPPIWAVILMIALGSFTAGVLLAFAVATPMRRRLFASIGAFNALIAIWNSLMLIVRLDAR